MTYLNNAATSHPKPLEVVEAIADALRTPPPSALRSTGGGDDPRPSLRQQLGQLLHIADHERIVLTSGATEALNRLIAGLDGDVIALTDNHNSVLRPLANLPGLRAMSDVPPEEKRTPRHARNYRICHVTSSDNAWQRMLTDDELLRGAVLILPHCSNVTGRIYDLPKICHLAHQRGMLVMADAAQSAGSIPIDVDGWGVDLIAFTGHKHLLGPQGTGGYYVRPGITMRPTLFGGTGRDSSIVRYEEGDWEYEVGTPNLPGLSGLLAGVTHVLQRGVADIFQQGNEQANWLIGQLHTLPNVEVHSPGGTCQGPVVSFNIRGLLPSDVGYMLQNSYDITVRTGLHCAPHLHKELHTHPHGSVRVSMACHTTWDDLHTLMHAVTDISHSL